MNTESFSGKTLGQYEVRDLLGVGGMGAVYRAYQINLKREVAIKILPSDYARQGGYIERFNREAQTAAQLEHAHIVPVYDYGTQRDISYIVMRLLTGGTLSQRFAQRAQAKNLLPSLKEVSQLLNQIASALDYAHNRGVIHRDIKPSNIMFDNHGNAYVVDFGIARLSEATSDLTGTNQMLGTPSYMPPEQWRGETLTPAADQYAMGILVYSFVTGRLPYEAPTPYALMHKHLNDEPTPPHMLRNDLPGSIHVVLNRALAKDPKERFPTVTAFAQAFASAVEGVKEEPTQFFNYKLKPEPNTKTFVPSVSVPRQTNVGKPTSNRKGVIWGASIILLLIIIGLAVFAFTPRDSELSVRQTSVALNLTERSLTLAPSTQGSSTETSPSPTRESLVVRPVTTQIILLTEESTETQVATEITALISPEVPTEVFTTTPEPSVTNRATATDTPTATEEVQTEEASITVSATDDVPIAPTEENTPIVPTVDIQATRDQAALLSAAVSETDEALALQAATESVTNTPVPSATPTDTPTPSETPTETAVPSPTSTDTLTPSATPTDTPTPSETPTETITPSPTATATLTPSVTPTDTPTPSETPTATITPSPTSTATPTLSPTATDTATPTLAPTLSPQEIALTPVWSNAAWTPFEQDFDGVTMVLVPAGCFMMGSEDFNDEKPAHQQCFFAPYWFDKTEVTNEQFSRFNGVAGRNSSFSGDQRPRENINWFEARAFCELRGARLPTEMEWEYAGRGPDNLLYPWGNEWNPDNAVQSRTGTQGTVDVGSIPAGQSWVGAMDMSGNVWEWVSSLYIPYPYDGEHESSTNTTGSRVMRGGLWFHNVDYMRASDRSRYVPEYWNYGVGFRCARPVALED